MFHVLFRWFLNHVHIDDGVMLVYNLRYLSPDTELIKPDQVQVLSSFSLIKRTEASTSVIKHIISHI